MNDVFPARLKRMLHAKEMSQHRLAALTDISYASVNSYTLGYREPCMGNLIRIANCLDASIDYLCGRTDELPDWYEKRAGEAFETVKGMIDPEGFKEWMHGQVGRA
jgi:transcriptional regulator with XRE-family HTH domain